VGFVVFFLVFILTGISFLRERIGGTLERLLATRRRFEIVVATASASRSSHPPGRAGAALPAGQCPH
jgi:hypothetical protein